MSMMGRFVSVSPDQLQEILDDPEQVEELFKPDARAATQIATKLTDAMKHAFQDRGP